MPIDEDLLKILACPKCKGKLEYIEDKEFICHGCMLAYKVEDGIPNFLIEEAQPVTKPKN